MGEVAMEASVVMVGQAACRAGAALVAKAIFQDVVGEEEGV
jgi:hypothetical protein